MKDLLAPWFQAGISSRLTGPDRLQRLQRWRALASNNRRHFGRPGDRLVQRIAETMSRRIHGLRRWRGRHRIDRDRAIGKGRRRNRTYRSNEDHGSQDCGERVYSCRLRHDE
jgi:hypothetical protein